MIQNADHDRAGRLDHLRRMLAGRLDDAAAAIETLLCELEQGDPRTSDWEGLHIAATRDDCEIELGTAYQQVLTRPRLRHLDAAQQVRVLVHAADFFQGILGDSELARAFLQRVLEVDPDHGEAFDRLERAYTSVDDQRELIRLYALVARNPPIPPEAIASKAAELIGSLPSFLALPEDVCNRLLAVVPMSSELLDVICAHCQRTGRRHLSASLRERAFYFRYLEGESGEVAVFRERPTARRPTPNARKVQIHGLAPSTYTRTARIACIEKGVPHELVPLDFRSDRHGQLHLFLKMPSLTHGRVRLYEALAICTYIDKNFGGPELSPDDPVEQARMMQWISASIDYLYPSFVRALRDDAVPIEVRAYIDQASQLIEEELANRQFLAGRTLSLAELFVAPMVDFAVRAGATQVGPATQQWLDELRARPSFSKTES
jgi:glutathione S-transferase